MASNISKKVFQMPVFNRSKKCGLYMIPRTLPNGSVTEAVIKPNLGPDA